MSSCGLNKFGMALAAPLLVASAMAQATNAPFAPARYQMVTPGLTLHELSPVKYFRILLGMNAPERERVLSIQPPEQQKAIMAKVQEYEALPKDIRETRLRQTELRWELGELMKVSGDERARRLKEVSPENRPF